MCIEGCPASGTLAACPRRLYSTALQRRRMRKGNNACMRPPAPVAAAQGVAPCPARAAGGREHG